MNYKTHLNQWNGTSIATKTEVITLESSVDSIGKPIRHTDVESTLNQRRLSTLKQRWKMFDFVIEMTSDFNVEITSGFNAETSDFNVERTSYFNVEITSDFNVEKCLILCLNWRQISTLIQLQIFVWRWFKIFKWKLHLDENIT